MIFFLIGPWNKIIDFSVYINKKFTEYVCQNDEIHFSAGISMVKANTPIDIIAHQSEHSLNNAKNKGKNSISIFERVIKWDKFHELIKKQDFFLELLEKEVVSKSMLYKINDIIDMSDREIKVINSGISYVPRDITTFKWRAFF